MSLRKLFGRFYFGLSLLILITLRASAEVINQTSPKDDLVNSSRLGFWISFFGLIGTILALILAAYIAKRQGTQITNLGKVQDQTFDITQKMQTKKVTQGNVNDFFKLEGDIKKNYYAVYFPIEYNKRV